MLLLGQPRGAGATIEAGMQQDLCPSHQSLGFVSSGLSGDTTPARSWVLVPNQTPETPKGTNRDPSLTEHQQLLRTKPSPGKAVVSAGQRGFGDIAKGTTQTQRR